jgi:hypothetical protein
LVGITGTNSSVLCPASLVNICSSPVSSGSGQRQRQSTNTNPQNNGSLPPSQTHSATAAIRNYVVTNTW